MRGHVLRCGVRWLGAVKAERCKTRPWCIAVCDLLSPVCAPGVIMSIFREKIQSTFRS